MAEEADKAPVPGSDEYNQQMADKFRNPGTPDSEQKDALTPPPMPEDGVDKFYDPKTGNYNWEAHAKEMLFNSKRSKKDEPSADPDNKDSKDNADAEPSNEVKDVVTSAGLQMDDLRKAISDTGNLTEDQYAALEKAGLPRYLVKDYVDATKERQETTTNRIVSEAGGAEHVGKVLTWAKETLSPEQIKAFNKQLEDPETCVPTLRTLSQMMSDASPTAGEPTLVEGGSPSGSSAAFKSRAEQSAAINDPRYKTDPAFRKSVHDRIQATRAGGGYVNYSA